MLYPWLYYMQYNIVCQYNIIKIIFACSTNWTATFFQRFAWAANRVKMLFVLIGPFLAKKAGALIRAPAFAAFILIKRPINPNKG
jgi:hypothetical protein